MSANAVYNYFTPIEEAIAKAFAAYGVDCYTPLGEIKAFEQVNGQEQQFVKAIPRVEIELQTGSNMGNLRASNRVRPASGFLREQARRSNLMVSIITDAELIPHREYYTTILFLLDGIGSTINEFYPPEFHAIGGIKVTGGQQSYTPQGGLFKSTINCDVDFSVLEIAWKEVPAPPIFILVTDDPPQLSPLPGKWRLNPVLKIYEGYDTETGTWLPVEIIGLPAQFQIGGNVPLANVAGNWRQETDGSYSGYNSSDNKWYPVIITGSGDEAQFQIGDPL